MKIYNSTNIDDHEVINDNLIFDCISGSRAYGLHDANSDYDFRGVYILPEEYYYGLNYMKSWNHPKSDKVYYEIGKFFKLLINCSPNILELLAIPETNIIRNLDYFKMIKPEIFLSKQCQHSFKGFAINNFKIFKKKMEFKPVTHVFRLLDMGINIAEGNGIKVEVEDKKILLEIKNGIYTKKFIEDLFEYKLKEFEDSFNKSSLPDKLNINEINKLLITIRRNYYADRRE